MCDVPALRFPEFTEEWKRCTLENCADFLDGLRKPIKSEDRKCEKGLYPYYGASGIIDYIDEYIFDGEYVLLSEDGANILDRNYRVAFIARGKIWVNNHAHVLLPYKNIDINFLSEALERLNYAIYNTGTTMPKLNQEVCRKICLNIPSREEQNKIGNLLFLLNERIATQNKIIEDLKKLKSAIYQKMFESLVAPTLKLGQIVEIIKGQQVNGTDLLEQGDYYVMNGGTTSSGWLNRYNTEANTISISEGGNSCGYVQYNTSRYWSGGHCYSLRILHPQETLDLYLYHFLKWQEDNIMALRIGSGLPNIQKKDLLRFPVILPTIIQQNKIVSILSAIEEKVSCEISITQYFVKQKEYVLSQLFI